MNGEKFILFYEKGLFGLFGVLLFKTLKARTTNSLNSSSSEANQLISSTSVIGSENILSVSTSIQSEDLTLVFFGVLESGTTGLFYEKGGLLIFFGVPDDLNGEKFVLFYEKGLFGLFGVLVNLFEGVIILFFTESGV